MLHWRRRFPRLSAFLARRAERREITMELRSHLEMRIQDNLDAGMSPLEATQEARQRFGNLLRVERECLDIRQPGAEAIMRSFMNDLRYSVRTAFKSPGFTAVVVLTLAIGIGVNCSIFSVVDAALLRPLPYPQEERVVQFWETNPIKGWNDDRTACRPANFVEWQQRSQSFTEMAAYYTGGHKTGDPKGISLSDFYLTGGDDPVRLQGLRVVGDLFSVLGVPAEIGRTFEASETWEGAHVVVLSHGLWQRSFGADPSLVGKVIPLNGVSTTVVGVMPSSFYFPSKDVDLWAPWGRTRSQIAQFQNSIVRVIARLKPDVRVQQARADMNWIALELAEERPVTNEKSGVGLAPMHDWDVSDTRSALSVFLGAVALVLLIACVNVANLLLARGATRTRELALRAALGAGRSRLIRQLMTESLLLSLIGGAAGLILAVMCNRLVVVLNPGGIPRLDEVRLDTRVVVFNVVVTLATAIVFGLLPAITSSRTEIVQSLNSGGQRTGQGIGTARTRDLLVISEIAVAFVLAIGAGLMIKSFVRLNQANPGFDSAHLLTLKTNLPDATYNSSSKQWTFYQQVLERLDGLPGVVSAAAVSVPPPIGSTYISDFSIQGRLPDDYGKEVLHNVVTPNYFETMRIPVISGRAFSDADTGRGSPVVIISDALALRHFEGRDPIGQHMKFSRPEVDGNWYTIVGVVKDVKQEGLGLEPRPEIYEPFSQMANNYMNFMVRTSGDPHGMIPAVLAQIKAVDKDLPPYNIYTMGEVLGNSVNKQRFMTILLAVFGSIALLLAAIGVYGVTSYSTAQRTGEMGIRMALGARRQDVLTLVIKDGLKLVAVGLAVGLAGAFVLTRLMTGLLYGVSSTDPATFVLTCGLLAGVAGLACYIPARRATMADPIIAVRHE